MPHQSVSEQWEELLVDGLLTRPDARHEHVFGVDVLRSVSRRTVTVFGDTHDFSRHPEMFQHGITHGGAALNKAKVFTIAAPQLLDIYVP